MFGLMMVLAALGIALLVGAPAVARLAVRGGDPIGLTRILQVAGILLILGALLLRPRNQETSAFPPPPDAPSAAPR